MVSLESSFVESILYLVLSCDNMGKPAMFVTGGKSDDKSHPQKAPR